MKRKKNTAPKNGLQEKKGETRIIVRSTYGDRDILDLYAGYVADKVRERIGNAKNAG